MPSPEQAAQFFTNRLKRRIKTTGAWARKLGLEAFRIYFRDIPEVPLAVDRYGPYLHISEFERPNTYEPDQREAWQELMTETAAATLGVPRERTFYKFRQQQKGREQYEKFATRSVETEIVENGLRFTVNLSDYLDTGLFLDHRNAREWVREHSLDRRVLNLFSYTATFSVYAAAGGAQETVSVDLSNTYCEWARENLRRNGFTEPFHRVVREDVFRFLREAVPRQFHLIVLDPPTFSNSSRMDRLLDIQRDHTELIHLTRRLLLPGGVLFFSTNRRSFKLDPNAFAGGSWEETSDRTIPEDFQRAGRIHRSFLFQESDQGFGGPGSGGSRQQRHQSRSAPVPKGRARKRNGPPGADRQQRGSDRRGQRRHTDRG